MVAASGSALPGDLAISWMDHFGDNLYNTYGSTEVAYASIATPADMRDEPSTAGKPPWATVVKIFDDKDHEVAQGESGRIFVGNSLLFEGYTGGGQKDMIDGLMSSGDVGRFDEEGRLFVEGRDDEMIVSGGENVFPKEVEDCLARHEAVVEVAAIGVDDDDYGKRLRAFVVLRDGKDASEDDLKGHVKENLARYKVPREIVLLDELPRNATGKVLKRELARLRRGRQPGLRQRQRLRQRRGRRVSGLTLGGPAPDFTLRDQFGQDVTLSSYRGTKAVALVFYPYAFSGVCTGEMAGIRDRLAEFMTFDSEVLAISCDPMFALRAFADSRRAQLPAALRLLAARRGLPRLRRLRRGRRLPAAVVVRRGQGRDRPLVGPPREPESAATSTNTSASSRRSWPERVVRTNGLDHLKNNPSACLWPPSVGSKLCPVEPLVTRDASGSTSIYGHFRRVRRLPYSAAADECPGRIAQR